MRQGIWKMAYRPAGLELDSCAVQDSHRRVPVDQRTHIRLLLAILGEASCDGVGCHWRTIPEAGVSAKAYLPRKRVHILNTLGQPGHYLALARNSGKRFAYAPGGYAY
jgi:hypothetical protein